MISFGERCYSDQYDELSDAEISGFDIRQIFLRRNF